MKVLRQGHHDPMRQPSLGILVAGLAAILLLVCLFLDWYQPGISAWTTFEVWDLVLAALAVAVLVRMAAELGVAWGGAARIPLGPVAAGVCVIVVVALLNHPPAALGRDVAVGAWLALGASVLLAIGALMVEAHLTVTVARDQRRTPPPPPETAATTPLADAGGPPSGSTRLRGD